jgi:hypothetical protein
LTGIRDGGRRWLSLLQTRWLMRYAIVSAAVCVALLVACDSQPVPYQDKQVLASVQILRNLLGKPEGLKIVRADQYSDGAICYTYRTRNRFGGLTDDVAVYDGDHGVSLAIIDVDSFTRHCLGHKATRDVTDYANYGLGF